MKKRAPRGPLIMNSIAFDRLYRPHNPFCQPPAARIQLLELAPKAFVKIGFI